MLRNIPWNNKTRDQNAKFDPNSDSEINSKSKRQQKIDQAKSKTWSSSVQNLLDQPPASFPLWVMMGGFLFCTLLGVWAYVGQIEDVGKGVGQLIPQGKTFKIEPINLGKVNHVLVQEGDSVKAGDTLVEFDTDLQTKEIERLEKQLNGYLTELTQKQNLINTLQSQLDNQRKISATEIQGKAEAIITTDQQIKIKSELLSNLELKQSNLKERLNKLNLVDNLTGKSLKQLQAEKEAYQGRMNTLKPLEKEGAVSQEFVFQVEQSLREIDKQITQTELQTLTLNKGQLFEIEQSLRDIETNLRQTEGDLILSISEKQRLNLELNQQKAQLVQLELDNKEQIEQIQVEITQLKAKIVDTKNVLSASQAQLNQQTLTSPVDGVVLSMDLQNVGQIIQSGKTVAEIAPENVPLVLSTMLPNQEAGFVKIGMPVKVKLDAYPYQDYGLIDGTVKSIGANAESNEELGQVYRIEVALQKDHIIKDGEKIMLKAGQTGTAEIVLRKRRIIDVLLEPIRGLEKSGISL